MASGLLLLCESDTTRKKIPPPLAPAPINFLEIKRLVSKHGVGLVPAAIGAI